jgi:hypothetical protein
LPDFGVESSTFNFTTKASKAVLERMAIMKTSAVAFTSSLIWSLALGHYDFPALIDNGAPTTDWQYVRQWTGYNTFVPVTNVGSLDIRCNVDGSTVSAPETLSIAAGTELGFTILPQVEHPGPMAIYLAQVPGGSTASSWDGSGQVLAISKDLEIYELTY